MGGGSTKSTTNQATNSSSNFTTTPTVPGFAASPVMNFMEQTSQWGQDLFKQPDQLATPANGLLQYASTNAFGLPTGQTQLNQAAHLASQAGNAAVPNYNAPTIDGITKVASSASAPVFGGSATAGQIMDNGLDQYMNPFLDNVVSTTLVGTDLNQAKQQNAQRAAAARGAAFGGSRDAIASTELLANQERERAGIEANLRAQGFDKATAMALADAQMRTQVSESNAANATQASIASAQIAAENARADAMAANQRAIQQALLGAQGGMFNISNQGEQWDRALSAAGLLTQNAATGSSIANDNIATQAGLGKTLWDIENSNNHAELEGLQAFQGLLDPSLWSPFVGQNVAGYENGTANTSGTQKSSGGLLGTLAGAASIASAFSDRRLKTSIVQIGAMADGLGVYEWNYVWGGPRQRGVMADEVAELRPWALGPEISGYATVNYGAL